MREPSQPLEIIEGRARTLDGDTIEVNGSIRVRFFGVDAPEYDQIMIYNGQEVECGQVAKQALKDRIGGQPVRCEVYDTDHYGRKCAVVFNSSGEDLNAWLCREGYVQAFTKVTRRYVPLQEEAKAARRGIWGGQMQEPAEYRRQKRQQQAAGGTGGGRPPARPQQGGHQGGYQQPHQQGGGYQQPHQQGGGYQQPHSGGNHGGGSSSSSNSNGWIFKLLEAVLGACLGGNKGRR